MMKRTLSRDGNRYDNLLQSSWGHNEFEDLTCIVPA